MLVCKDMCKFVRLLRGWQEENIEEEEEGEKKQTIVCGKSVSSVSCFLSSVRLTEWGADVLGMPMTMKTTELAVRGGHLCTLDWLLSRGVLLERNCFCESKNKTHKYRIHGACCLAAETGHLSVLQYLRSLEPPCPWDEETCMYAAKNGHLHVLQWARSQPEPCPWDEWTCVRAAEKGHLHVLQWARSQAEPCPWFEPTAKDASEWGIF